MPYYSELLEDVPEGVESREGHRGDQEDDGFYLSGFLMGGVGDEIDTRESRAFCMDYEGGCREGPLVGEDLFAVFLSICK